MSDVFLLMVLPTLIAWLLLVVNVKQDIKKGEVYDKSEANCVIFIFVTSCIPGVSIFIAVVLLWVVVRTANIGESLANLVNEKSKVYRERN